MAPQDPIATEGAAPEVSVADTPEGRIAAAAAALASDPPADDEGAAEAPEPAEDAPPEAEAAEPPAAEPEAAEAQEPPAEPDGELAWRFAQLRRQERAIQKQQRELKELADRLERQKSDYESAPDARRDPLGFADWAANRAGLTPQQLYELQTHRAIKGKPDPEQEMESLRAEVEALKLERQRERAEAEKLASEQQRESAFAADVAEVSRLQEPGFARRWPHAAAWPKDRLQMEARAAVQWAYQSHPDMSHTELADVLERVAKQEWDHMHKTLGAGLGTEDRETSQARDGQGTPAADAAKPAGKKPRSTATLTNDDAAQGSGVIGELSDAERLKRAGEALAGALA